MQTNKRIATYAALLASALTATACSSDAPAGEGSGSEETGTSGVFAFSEADASAFVQVDRIGMPAVGTAVIMSKDAYNASSPVDDAAGTYVDEIIASVTGLHDALDDDLLAAGLVACAVDECVAQAAPLIVPDTIKVDASAAAGFPNGRLLTDPVIDVTLAVILLDLSVDGQSVTSLVGVNPTQNDQPFADAFPFLAPPHEP